MLTSDEIETESKNNWARNWAKIHETQKLSTNFACLGWKAGAQGGHKHRIVDTLAILTSAVSGGVSAIGNACPCLQLAKHKKKSRENTKIS